MDPAGSLAPVKGLPRVSKFSSGYEHVLAVTGSGQLMSWGWNEHGNLGNGSTQNSPLPVLIDIRGKVVTDCCAGSGHSFAVAATNTTPV